MLVQRGVDIYTVQILLGHKDGRMTKRYAHLSTKNLQSAISVLDKTDFDYNLTTVGHLEESDSCNALNQNASPGGLEPPSPP